MEHDLVIFTDGGGKSSYVGGKACAVITKNGKTPIEILYREYEEEMTCNEAEYFAVILALEERLYNERILLKTDSNLVVKQLATVNPWRINFDHLRLLNSLVQDVIRNLELKVEFQHVPRDDNLAGRFIEGRLVFNRDNVRIDSLIKQTKGDTALAKP